MAEVMITLTGKSAELFGDIQARLDATPEIPMALTNEDVVTLALLVFKQMNETPMHIPIAPAFNVAVARFQAEYHNQE